MKTNVIKPLLLLLMLLLVQMYVMPFVHFWSISPCIYLFALLVWPVQWSVYAHLLLAFASGMLLDFNLDTPGLHSMSFCLAAYLRLPLLRWTSSKEDVSLPSEKSMGFLSYWKYACLLVLIHHSCFFLLESFSFFSLPLLLLRIFGSTMATLLLCFFLERFR